MTEINKFKWKGPSGFNPLVGEVWRGKELVIDNPATVDKLKAFMSPIKEVRKKPEKED